MRFRAPLIAVLLLALAVPGALARSATPIHWSAPRLADATPPFSSPTGLSGVACPTAGDCLAVGGGGTVVTVTGSGRTEQTGVDHGAGLSQITCPSSSLCVIAESEALLTTTDPTATRPKWTRTVVPLPAAGSWQGISCASASLCLGWTDTGTVVVSTDPTGGASTWHAVTLAPPSQGLFLYSAACAPGSTLCVASLGGPGDAGGEVATSTDPVGGAAAWTTTATTGLPPMVAMACTGQGTLCAGTSQLGVVETSTDPAAGGTTWSGGQVTPPTGTVEPAGFTCADAQACVVALDNGAVAASTDPAAGAASYTVSPVIDAAGFGTARVNQVACPTETECLVPDRTPGLATVTLGSSPSATVAGDLGGTTAIIGLACPATSLCVGVDGSGGIIRSTDPVHRTTPWARTLQSGATQGLNAVACPSRRFCVAVGAQDHVATTSHPATAGQWNQAVLPFKYPDDEGGPDQRYDLTSITCPSARFCLAGNSEYGLMASTHPAGGAHAWRLIRLAAFNADLWVTVSCPTSRFCAAGDGNFGRIAVSTHPLRSGKAWHLFKIAPGVGSLAPAITAMSCPSTRFCVAGDARGSVHWSTHPNGGPHAWHAARIDHHRLIAMRCRSERFCVALAAGNRAFASSDPRGGARAWHGVTLATGRFPLGNAAEQGLSTLACAPHRLCLAATGIGAVFPGAS